MDFNNHQNRGFIRQRDEDLPLDKVLKPRHAGKKLPDRNSSDSQPKDFLNVPKLKPISKEKTEKTIIPTQPTQANSTDIVRQLIFEQSLKPMEIEELMVKLKNIKSLKYEKKLTEKIREALVETVFAYNYPRFVSIMSAFNPRTLSSHLIAAVFQGFILAWKNQNFDNLGYFVGFFNVYCNKLPNCLNKRYIKWLVERAKQKETIYAEFRGKVYKHVDQVIEMGNRQRSIENEKIIGLIVSFELMEEVNNRKLMLIVPLEKIKEYIDNDNLPTNNTQNQKSLLSLASKQPKMPEPIQTEVIVPPLVHNSIRQLLRQNNLKQTQKIVRANKIPYTQYPEFVLKLELKYLEYIDRSYPVWFVDELIQNKRNLVENFVDMCIKRKKYDYVEHFINKYRLMGVTQPNYQLIIPSPLAKNDCFGPTESHVLHKCNPHHFVQLSDFDIGQDKVIWIDSKTIHMKPQADYLINLLYLKEVGIDSESSSGIHVFEKSKLQIIQIYDPVCNVCLLFDVRDFKSDKKKRTRKGQNRQEQNGSVNLPIDLEGQEKRSRQGQIQAQTKLTQKQEQSLSQKQAELQQKAWQKFTKLFQNIFKRSRILGHCLHTDLGDIIQELDLKINIKEIKFTDSQLQFKKHYPQQTKSKLSYLAQKCYDKELSKYEQCSAWDLRPLREAQRHYAALDAVLPYKLVKWMESNQEKKEKKERGEQCD